jgi:hypothetical protein
VYDLLGRKLAVVYDGEMTYGQKMVHRYMVPGLNRLLLIYKLTTRSGIRTGKLIPVDFD